MVFVYGQNKLHYQIVGEGKKTVVVFPPGVGDPQEINYFINKLKIKYKLIILSSPGINGTTLKNNNVYGFSYVVSKLLVKLKISSIHIIGISYGGNIGIYLTNIVPVKKIVLITSGEYFTNLQKVIFYILFFPLYRINFLRHFYINIIRKKNIIDFSQYNVSDYNIILDRWLEIIFHKLPDKTVDIKSLLFFADNDNILNKNSADKLLDIFKNKEVHFVSSGHLGVTNNFSSKEFGIIDDYLNT